MTKFADQLFADLMQEHGPTLQYTQPPAPATRRGSRPMWLTAGALATAGVAATTMVTLTGSSPAYAVTQNADGTVTVRVGWPSGMAGANAKLHNLGLPVVAVPVRSGCTGIDVLAKAAAGHQAANVTAATGDDGSVTVDVTGVPTGYTALIAFGESASGITGSMVLVKGKAPDCVSLPTGGGAGTTNSEAGDPAKAGTDNSAN
ncbi:hypothetical protein [Streptomyces sp. NPDC050263]|uniref:hypothetical protein n=1 Tax=Streptomyces sp. NPDC050263 TaxID=3155037 RepID=UPI0034490B00